MEWRGPFRSTCLWGVGQRDWVVISGLWPLASLACKWKYQRPQSLAAPPPLLQCRAAISGIAFDDIKIKSGCLNEPVSQSLHRRIVGIRMPCCGSVWSCGWWLIPRKNARAPYIFVSTSIFGYWNCHPSSCVLGLLLLPFPWYKPCSSSSLCS